MDIERLIAGLSKEAYGSDVEELLLEATTALSALQADLARVTAERDGAVEEVKHLKAVMREKGIVVIPPKYPWGRPEWNW